MTSRPILYSFRRCPYAIRARLALQLSQISVELREIVLKNKPPSMLKFSPKGTVPVLVELKNDDGNTVIDESLDIMLWALKQQDPYDMLKFHSETSQSLIDLNDGEFKHYLDRYKYADRYPEATESDYRSKAEEFITKLNSLLETNEYLLGNKLGFADITILPFVRQFAHVNLTWFESSQYINVIRWLNNFKSSELFLSVMKKYPAWAEGDEMTLFPDHDAQ